MRLVEKEDGHFLRRKPILLGELFIFFLRKFLRLPPRAPHPTPSKGVVLAILFGERNVGGNDIASGRRLLVLVELLGRVELTVFQQRALYDM